MLIFSGQEDHKFYIILRGEIKLVTESSEGGKSETIMLKEKEFFGDSEMEPKGPQKATAITTSETELIILEEGGYHEAFVQAAHDEDILDEDVESLDSHNALIKQQLSSIARHCRYRPDGKPRSVEERIDLAVEYIRASQNSRSVKKHRFRPYLVHEIDAILNNSTLFYYIFLAVVALHLILAIGEYTSVENAREGSDRDQRYALLAVEWFIVTFYSSCYIGEFYNAGRKAFLRKRINIIWTVVMFLFILDLLIATGSGFQFFRFSRVLRPFMLFLKIPLLRIAYTISVRTLFRLIHIWIIFIIFFLIFSCIGLYLFSFQRDIYNEEEFNMGIGYPNCQGPCIPEGNEPLPFWVFTSFASFEQSLITLFVLLTTENFPDVSHPPYMVSTFYNTYFIVFWLLGEAFLLQLLLALIFNVYKDLMEKYMLKQMWNERFALHFAFECLDVTSSGAITPETFTKLLQRLKPNYDLDTCRAFFDFMDLDKNGGIEEKEFCDFGDFITYEIQESSSEQSVDTEKDGSSRIPTILCFSPETSKKIVYIHDSAAHDYFVDVIIVLEFLTLLSFGIASANLTRDEIVAINALQVATWALFVLDTGIFISIKGIWQALSTRWSQFDIVVNVVTFVGLVFLFQGNAFGFLRFFGMLRVFKLARYFERYLQNRGRENRLSKKERTIREVHENEGLKGEELDEVVNERMVEERKLETENKMTILDTMLNMIPWFLFMCLAMLCVLMYVYAIVGTELFSGQNGNNCNGAAWIEYDTEARFCDFLGALTTLLQIITTSNWHEIMYPAIRDHGTSVSIYFISFYFLAAIIMFNVMTAVFIEIFQTINEDSDFTDESKNTAVRLDDVLRRKNADSIESDDEYMVSPFREIKVIFIAVFFMIIFQQPPQPQDLKEKMDNPVKASMSDTTSIGTASDAKRKSLSSSTSSVGKKQYWATRKGGNIMSDGIRKAFIPEKYKAKFTAESFDNNNRALFLRTSTLSSSPRHIRPAASTKNLLHSSGGTVSASGSEKRETGSLRNRPSNQNLRPKSSNVGKAAPITNKLTSIAEDKK